MNQGVVLDPLRVLISSTGDLQDERDAAEAGLKEIEILGDRFEFWPALSEPPIGVCMRRVYRSDAIVLILGKRYGSLIPDLDISYTHAEYRHADQFSKPIFVYLIKMPDSEREPRQQEFIKEVKQKKRLYKIVSSVEELKEEVKRSFQTELINRFRQVSMMKEHVRLKEFDPNQLFQKVLKPKYEIAPPSGKLLTPLSTTDIVLSDDLDEAFKTLIELHEEKKDNLIHALALKYEAKFKKDPRITNTFYISDINLAIDGFLISNERLMEIFDFFGSEEAKSIWPSFIIKYNKANILLILKNYPGAIKLYKEVIAEKPDFLVARVNLGNAYKKAKDTEAALKCYEEALAFGKPFELLFGLATLLIQEEREPEKALSYFNQITVSDMHPGGIYSSYYWWKAKVHYLLKQYPEGLAAIEEVLRSAPNEEGAWWDAARLYVRAYREDKRQLEPALGFWNRFLKKLPGIGAAWAELGYVHWKLREIKDREKNCRLGIQAYKRSIELGVGDEALAWAYIGRLYENLGELVESAESYKKAADRNPEEFGYMYGESLAFLRKFEEALPWIEAGVKQDEKKAIRWSRLGICQFNVGEIKEAEKSYLKAIELDSDGRYPEPRFNLGGLYWNKEDIINALKVWGEAVERFPDYPDVRQVREILTGAKLDHLIEWPNTP